MLSFFHPCFIEGKWPNCDSSSEMVCDDGCQPKDLIHPVNSRMWREKTAHVYWELWDMSDWCLWFIVSAEDWRQICITLYNTHFTHLLERQSSSTLWHFIQNVFSTWNNLFLFLSIKFVYISEKKVHSRQQSAIATGDNTQAQIKNWA